MKFSIDPADLKEAVRFALTAIDSRPTSPIMGGALLEVEGDQLRTSGSNYAQYSSVEVPADVYEAGQALLNATMLGKLVGKFKAKKPVEVRVEKERAYLSQGATKFEMSVMPAGEYPKNLNGSPEEIGSIDGEILSKLVRSVANMVGSANEALAILSAVRLEIGDELNAFTTDRYRIATNTAEWARTCADEFVVNVPAAWFRTAEKTIAGHTVLHVTHENGETTRFGVTSGGYTTSTTLISGDYPKVRSFFTNAATDRHTLNRATLIDAIDAVSVMAERGTPIIAECDGDKIIISGGMQDGAGTSTATVETDNGATFRIGLNPVFFLDVLRAIETDELNFAPNGPKPVHVTPTAGSAEYIIMPVRLTAANTI